MLRALALLALGLLLLLAGAVAALQVPVVATWAARELIQLAPLAPGYRLGLDRAGGNWLTSLHLRGVRLLHGNDTLAVVNSVNLHYNPIALVSHTRIDSLSGSGAMIEATRGARGWDIAQAIGGQGKSDSSSATTVAIDHLTLQNVRAHATLSPDSVFRISSLALRADNVQLGTPTELRLNRRSGIASQW